MLQKVAELRLIILGQDSIETHEELRHPGDSITRLERLDIMQLAADRFLLVNAEVNHMLDHIELG